MEPTATLLNIIGEIFGPDRELARDYIVDLLDGLSGWINRGGCLPNIADNRIEEFLEYASQRAAIARERDNAIH